METNEQGLVKEEKIMFLLLGIILLVSIGVLIINSISSKKEVLDDNDTPIKETSGQKDNVVDENINATDENLIEDESEDIVVYQPVININSSLGSKKENQSKPKPKPEFLDWVFKDSMVTNAFSGDVVTIERNVLLTNGQEAEANIVIMKYENDSWIIIDSTASTFIVDIGLYKYIYSYGSSTKELLLTVSNRVVVENVDLLDLNESIDETSSITIEEFNKINTLISNSIIEINNDVYSLTINGYQETNNLLPLVIETNEDMTDKNISTTSLGIFISKEQKDWYEILAPNSILLWLDLNAIDLTNNVVNLEIDGVQYEFYMNILINNFEESNDTEDSELENDLVENDDLNNESETDSEQLNNYDDELLLDGENEEKDENDNQDIEPSLDENIEEEELDPLEPQEEDIVENSSQEIPSLEENKIEDNNLQPNQNDMSNELS